VSAKRLVIAIRPVVFRTTNQDGIAHSFDKVSVGERAGAKHIGNQSEKKRRPAALFNVFFGTRTSLNLRIWSAASRACAGHN
jgi:hypothetical protein